VEAELREALAPLPVFRLDADAARRKHGIAETLARFAGAEAGVLVGTQMVAQGHDFPEVELAVVQDADATLRFPDFRAEERTFGPAGGRVMVQTMSPQTACLRHAATHDAAAFLDEEIERRRALSYPPFSTLIDVIASAPSQEAADRAAGEVARRLGDLKVLGPAPLFRLKDLFRSRVVVKATERPPAVAAIGAAVHEVASDRALRSVKFAVDVAPQ
jgi:primosomal protein N' (replication factor Y)